MYYGLLGSETDVIVLCAILLTLIDFVIMVELPYHTAHVLSMLPFHPTHDFATTGFFSAHERGNLPTERVGQARGVIAIDTQEEFPEERAGHVAVLLCGCHFLHGHLVFGVFDEDAIGMFGDILVVGSLGIGLVGILPVE